MKNAVLLILLVFGMMSCEDKVDPIGKWDDNIKLSTDAVTFGAQEDSVLITTEGDWWWVDNIQLGDSVYPYVELDSVDLEAESYTIQTNEYVVERREKTGLFIKMNANDSGSERVLRITLEAGDYFDYVLVTQAGE